VTWDDDPARFVCNAIAPAEVAKVVIHEKDHSMEIIVPDDQLSLAIGRKGQNVRLAAQLTGWNIDIFNETKHDDMTRLAKLALVKDLEIEESLASIFYNHGYRKTHDLADSPLEDFLAMPGINQEELKGIHQRAVAAMKLPESERPGAVFLKEAEKKRIAEERARLEIKMKEMVAKELAAKAEAAALEELPVAAAETQDKEISSEEAK
jgi:N utilization substance protein A